MLPNFTNIYLIQMAIQICIISSVSSKCSKSNDECVTITFVRSFVQSYTECANMFNCTK